MKSWNDLSSDRQGLASDSQSPRYQVIAGMIREFCPRSHVPDVGCGEAVLWQYLLKLRVISASSHQRRQENRRAREMRARLHYQLHWRGLRRR